MAEFVTCRHPDVEGTAVLSVDGLRFMPGWEPTDPSVVVPSAADGTVGQILADVGDDPARAAAALEAEQSREHPRVSLVRSLTAITNTTQES